MRPLFYSNSRKPTLRIAKFEGIAYINPIPLNPVVLTGWSKPAGVAEQFRIQAPNQSPP